MQLLYGPELSEIEYSRDETIAAVRDFYGFLIKMYLNESAVVKPPEGGWPNITADILRPLGKTDEVIDLLCHLPYIRSQRQVEGAPSCNFANWDSLALSSPQRSGSSLKVVTEGASFHENVPAHVVGLTSGGRENCILLLDTELGVIYWPDCIGRIKDNTENGQIQDDAYDYAADNEVEWRADAGAWAIPDFFEVLKDQFRELQFIPNSPTSVLDIDMELGPGNDALVPELQEIYHKHGWPDLERYRKQDCLEAVQRTLETRYPEFADY